MSEGKTLFFYDPTLQGVWGECGRRALGRVIFPTDLPAIFLTDLPCPLPEKGLGRVIFPTDLPAIFLTDLPCPLPNKRASGTSGHVFPRSEIPNVVDQKWVWSPQTTSHGQRSKKWAWSTTPKNGCGHLKRRPPVRDQKWVWSTTPMGVAPWGPWGTPLPLGCTLGCFTPPFITVMLFGWVSLPVRPWLHSWLLWGEPP